MKMQLDKGPVGGPAMPTNQLHQRRTFVSSGMINSSYLWMRATRGGKGRDLGPKTDGAHGVKTAMSSVSLSVFR